MVMVIVVDLRLEGEEIILLGNLTLGIIPSGWKPLTFLHLWRHRCDPWSGSIMRSNILLALANRIALFVLLLRHLGYLLRRST